LRTIFSAASAPNILQAEFELMIGTSVLRQAILADLPPEAMQVLNGYFGGQYMMAGHVIWHRQSTYPEARAPC
jgi:hypothetical protein